MDAPGEAQRAEDYRASLSRRAAHLEGVQAALLVTDPVRLAEREALDDRWVAVRGGPFPATVVVEDP